MHVGHFFTNSSSVWRLLATTLTCNLVATPLNALMALVDLVECLVLQALGYYNPGLVW